METAFNYMSVAPHTHTASSTSFNLKTLFCIVTFGYYFYDIFTQSFYWF